jgi:hypothetical protein
MKRILCLLIGTATLAAMSACVVAPARHGYVQGGGVVYVAPTYASPGVGWAWEHHPREGWGWHNPDRGWHRGWRDN